jgi:hypothetical protein
MSQWNKLIVSGSDAQVSSMDISTIPILSGGPANSLVIEDGQVHFQSLPSIASSNQVEEGGLMISNIDIDGYSVYVKNPSAAYTTALLYIPWNHNNIDLNGDGYVSTADLLLFLGDFGAVNEQTLADITLDGSVTTGDLLEFLGAFGIILSEFEYGVTEDTRPYIDWKDAQYNWIQEVLDGDPITHSWIDDDGFVTAASVTTLYDAIVTANTNDNAFWAMLPPNSVDSENVDGYMTSMQGLTTPTFEVFIYIYFTQISGTGTIIVNGESTSIYGGHDFYNHNGLEYSIGSPGVPTVAPMGYDTND